MNEPGESIGRTRALASKEEVTEVQGRREEIINVSQFDSLNHVWFLGSTERAIYLH